jgi:hypothetical protein
VVGTVDFWNSHVSAVSLTEEDDAGDWIVYDRYSLDGSGAIRTLDRTINILPGDRSEREVFLINGGKANKRSTASLRLSTGKPIPPSKDWIPDVPVVTNVKEFPFWSLIDSKSLEVWSKGRACIDGSQP